MQINKLFNATTFRILAFALMLVAPLLASAQSRTLDKVLVVVDDDVILESEYNARLEQVLSQFDEAQLASIPRDALREQIIDQLIIENLQLQMAYRAGIRIDDNMLNQAMGNIAQNRNMSFEEFASALQENGVYNQTRQQISQELSINQFQSGAINNRIDITRQEIENYLRSEAGLSDIAPEFHVAHILIPNSTSAPNGSVEELASLLHQQIVDGANILQIAASGEISGVSISGGDLGWNKAETLPDIFRDVVPDLELGETSEPFSSTSGFHLVQLLDERGGTDLQIDQTHLRHIMLQPNEIRTEEQTETAIRQLHQRILNGEDFADLARQNTEDTNSMVSGGDLDWVSRGQLPDDLMDKIELTEIGELSEPFNISTGWHIIEVLERRIEDVTEENKRFQAQLFLRDRKFENEKQNWLTEIRDEAYIDIKEE